MRSHCETDLSEFIIPPAVDSLLMEGYLNDDNHTDSTIFQQNRKSSWLQSSLYYNETRLTRKGNNNL